VLNIPNVIGDLISDDSPNTNGRDIFSCCLLSSNKDNTLLFFNRLMDFLICRSFTHACIEKAIIKSMPRIHMIVKTILITVKSIRSTDIEKSCIQFPLSDKPGLSIVELDETVSLFPFPVNILPKFNNLVGMYGNNKVISNKTHTLYCHLDDN